MIGKAHRLGLQSRPSPVKPNEPEPKPRPKAREKAPPAPAEAKSPAGGAPAALRGSEGTAPRGLDVVREGGQEVVYFTGKDPGDGQARCG